MKRNTFLSQVGLVFGMSPFLPIRNPVEYECVQELRKQFIQLQVREMENRAALFKILLQKHGNDILRIVEDYIISSTRTKLQAASIPIRNLNAVMEYLWDHTGATHTFAVETRTEHKLKLKVSKCLYAETMVRLNARKIGYSFYCAYDIGFCQGLNPAISFTRTKTLMQGHSCCDHTYAMP